VTAKSARSGPVTIPSKLSPMVVQLYCPPGLDSAKVADKGPEGGLVPSFDSRCWLLLAVENEVWVSSPISKAY
jgi:hypothetical protein